MNTVRTIAFLATSLLAAASCAQNASPPLNLKLPANAPAASASSAAPVVSSADTKPAANPNTSNATAQANTATSNYAKDPPGTYYGDTSGAMGNTHPAAGQPVVTCDDATYNQPQVHGSVGVGVESGRHGSGSYTGAGVTLSQAFGSCTHPTGGMSISVGGTQGHYGR
jgi:hypothetical protein